MRSTYQEASVRLYHLDEAGDAGGVVTLFYGPLSEALDIAAREDEATQAGLWLSTDNDVVAYLDLAEG